MKSLLVLLITLMLSVNCLGQYKNIGIKTRYPPPSSGNLISGNATNYSESHQAANQYQPQQFGASQADTYDRYNGNFKPAEYYQGGRDFTVTRPPVILDATAEFINKTRSAMASGVCYKEVP